jgi:hypothetical protein
MMHVRVPDGRSHGRTPAVQLLIDERNHLLRSAARFYPGASDREVARRLRDALALYLNGRFRRDRVLATCPAQHKGKLTETLFLLLRTHEHVPSVATIRRILGGSCEPRSDG